MIRTQEMTGIRGSRDSARKADLIALGGRTPLAARGRGRPSADVRRRDLQLRGPGRPREGPEDVLRRRGVQRMRRRGERSIMFYMFCSNRFIDVRPIHVVRIVEIKVSQGLTSVGGGALSLALRSFAPLKGNMLTRVWAAQRENARARQRLASFRAKIFRDRMGDPPASGTSAARHARCWPEPVQQRKQRKRSTEEGGRKDVLRVRGRNGLGARRALRRRLAWRVLAPRVVFCFWRVRESCCSSAVHTTNILGTHADGVCSFAEPCRRVLARVINTFRQYLSLNSSEATTTRQTTHDAT